MSCLTWLVVSVGTLVMTEASAMRRQALGQVENLIKNDVEAAVAAMQMTEKALVESMAEVASAVDRRVIRSSTRASAGLLSSVLSIVFGLILFCTFLAILMVVLLTCRAGSAIKLALENLDRETLGVEITVDSVSITPWSLRVDIRNLKVGNPIGSGYVSDSMFSVDHLLVDVSTTELLKSLGRHVVVQKMVVDKLYTIVEKHSLRTSNVKEVHEFLEGTKPSGGADAEQECEDGTQVSEAAKLPEKGETERKITLHEVRIQDVDLRFQIEQELFGVEHVTGTNLALSDIVYRDFSKTRGAQVMDDVALFLLQTVLKTILSNVAGKQVGDHFF